MYYGRDYEDPDNVVYLAGERVSPGHYRQIGNGRRVVLDREDVLPASMDGRVACYSRVANTWEEISSQRGQRVPVLA
jgi:hypothetical protein